MGVSMSYLAVKDKEKTEIFEIMSLRGTGNREDIPESSIVGASLRDSWYLVLANEYESRLFTSKVLGELSSNSQLVVCMAEEHVMHSFSAGWQNGKQIWSVHHKGDEGDVSHLACSGELPAIFTDIEQKSRRDQSQSDKDVDFIFEVPVELFRALTGFRYDRDIEGSDEPFEILERRSGNGERPADKPWWKFW